MSLKFHKKEAPFKKDGASFLSGHSLFKIISIAPCFQQLAA